MPFKFLREDPKHFVAHNGKGEVLIAKRGLSPATRERYQKLCRGGEVKPKAMAEGGEVDPLDSLETDEEAQARESKRAAAAKPVKPGDPGVQAIAFDDEGNAKPAKPAPQKKAAGGEIKGKGMNLSKHKLIGETDAHWHIQGPGGSFKVAKKGIGKALGDRIAQHFAEGGEAEPLQSVPPPEAEVTPAPAQDPYMAEWLARTQPSPVSPPVDPGALPTQELGGASPNDLAAATGNPPPSGEPAPLVPDRALEPIPVSQAQLNAAFTPEGTQGAPASTAPAAAPAALAGAPTPATPDATPGIQKQIADSYAKAQAAEQAKADVAKKEAAEALIVQQKNEENRQALTANWQKAWQGWEQRGAEMRQAILDQKIDPNRYWNEKSTGGKISAAIGLILGGMGSGLTHQPNAALQVIENAINRDLDAQKAELGKKETLLGFHMQEGHALQASYQLAKADALDAAAAKLQMVSTKYAGDKAQASAQGAIAALQAQAAQTRQQVAAAGLQMQLHGMQLKQAEMGLAMSQLQYGALQALTSGQPQPGQPGKPGAKMGTTIDPRAIEFLPDHMRERLVTLPDGSYALGRTAKAAEETSKAFEGAAVLRDKIARYNALLTKHPHGVFSTTDSADFDTAKALHESILTDINGLAGLNRFTSEEAKVYAGRIPDITSMQVRATGHQAKLAELGKEIDDKVWNVSRQYLNLPARKRPEFTR